MTDQKVECPICKSPIFFNVRMLLAGSSFNCNNCNASISLRKESTQTVKKTMEEFETLKQTLSVKKGTGTNL